MVGLLAVQPLEVATIDGQHGAVLGNGESQHARIFNALVVLPSFAHPQHIMPQAAQYLDNLKLKFSLA